MPYPNFHAARQKSPGDFDPTTFRTIQIADGITAIAGKMKHGDGSMMIQTYRFDKSKFTPEQAKKWLTDHNLKWMSFEEATG